MAFRVMLRMCVKPGMEQEFERVWRGIGDAVTGDPGNRGQWLCRSAEEDGVYYVMSDWADEPRFRAFEQSPGHVEHRAKLHPYRTGGSMATMHVVAEMPGSAEA